MASFLNDLAHSPVVRVLELFLAAFPVVYAFLAINASRQFFLDRRGIVTQRLEPGSDDVDEAHHRWPRLTVAISVRDGAETISRTLSDLSHLAWPAVDIVVVDDGSTDATPGILDRFDAGPHRIRVVHKPASEGKATALQEILAEVDTEILLVCDDDVGVPPATVVLLAAQLAHHDDLAAVTANPRMVRTERLVEKLQAIEFSSTVSTQRRGHAAWGRISTMSGVCTLFRTSALRSVGGFDPDQPAEDIELTWRLQCAGWRVGYEPHAVVGTYPARTLRSWFRQRRRWAAGLVRALRANGRDALRLRNAVTWPLVLEAVASIVWCHLLVVLTVLWVACVAVGVSPSGNSPIVGAWGTLALLVTVAQINWGMHLDREDDPGIRSLRWYTPLFPLAYWWMMAATVVVATVPALVTRRRRVRW